MVQIKTFYDGDRSDPSAAEQASKWLMQQDGRIDVKTIMTDTGGSRFGIALAITVVYETYDGARLAPGMVQWYGKDGLPLPAPEGS